VKECQKKRKKKKRKSHYRARNDGAKDLWGGPNFFFFKSSLNLFLFNLFTMPLGISLRRKEEVKKTVEKSLLEELCGDDKELYTVLNIVLHPFPASLPKDSIGSYVEGAEELEKAIPDYARLMYQGAGEQALYQGDSKLAQKYFGKCAGLSGQDTDRRRIYEFFGKEENVKKAIVKAQEFYEKSKPATTETKAAALTDEV